MEDITIPKDTAKECLEAINPASDGSETLASMEVPRRPNIPPVPKPIIAGEADEKLRKELVAYFRTSNYDTIRGIPMKKVLAWFKKQKPTEWSEKDERMLERVIDTIGDSILECDCDDTGTKARFALEEERKWLKSLPKRFK